MQKSILISTLISFIFIMIFNFDGAANNFLDNQVNYLFIFIISFAVSMNSLFNSIEPLKKELGNMTYSKSLSLSDPASLIESIDSFYAGIKRNTICFFLSIFIILGLYYFITNVFPFGCPEHLIIKSIYVFMFTYSIFFTINIVFWFLTIKGLIFYLNNNEKD